MYILRSYLKIAPFIFKFKKVERIKMEYITAIVKKVRPFVSILIIFGVFTGSLKSLAFAAPLVNAFFYDNYIVAEEIIIMIVVYYIISLVLTGYMARFLLQKKAGL